MRCLLLLFSMLAALQVFPNKVDSLRALSASGTHDSIRLRAMIDLAWELRDTAPEEAVNFADQASALARQLQDSASWASALLRKSVVLRKQGETGKALQLIEQAVVLKKAAGDTLGFALALGNLAQVHNLLGHYDQAVTHNLASIQLLEQLGQTEYLAASYNNLAGIHASLGQHQKAATYYGLSLQLAIDRNDSGAVSRAWYNLGVASFDLGDLHAASDHYLKALRYAIRHDDLLARARLHNGIGSIAHTQRDYDRALAHFFAADSLFSALSMVPELVMVYNNIASVHEMRQDRSSALTYYHRAATLAGSVGNVSDLHHIYLNLSRTHESAGMTDSALHYFRQHTLLKDSLFNEEKNRQIVEVQEKYESARKDQAIAELNQEQARQETQIALRNYGLGAAGLLSITTLIIGINYYQKLKAQRALAAKDAELNRQRVMDLVRDHELKTVNAYLDGEATERKRVAGELHDRLGSQLATVKLHYDHLASQQVLPEYSEHFNKANALLGTACAEVRHIAHNLATGVLSKFGLVSAIENLCETVSASGQLRVQVDAFELADRLSPAMEVALFRSVQELVTNAIKHAKATELQVQLVQHEDYLNIMVSDNGKGFSKTAPRGLGLKNIADRTNAAGGSFSIDSTPGHGTTVVIEVPMAEQLKTGQI